MKRLITTLVSGILIFFLEGGLASEASLEIHFIDVGEGDASLIKIAGGETVLIDAGNLITGFKVSEYLKANGIKKIDHLIVSHPHSDHFGGVFLILQAFEVESTYDNGQDLSELSQSEDIYRWYQDFVRNRRKYQVLKAGDQIPLTEGSLEVFWPGNPPRVSGTNSNSLVLQLVYHRFKCLFTGDLDRAGEDELLKRNNSMESDVLKVSHHGAGDASSEGFLKAILPEVSVISVDKENVRGFPSDKVIQRLRSLNSKVYRTDENGNIVIKLENDRLSTKTEK